MAWYGASKIQNFVALFILIFFLASSFVFAADDTHTVKQIVGELVVLPSAPQNLTATATSTSQIDLTWDASVPGDFAVAGYTIFRDGVQIDTTAGLTYSDTGLTPSTTYSYQVSAYDTEGNDGDLSSSASATTFDEEVDDTGGDAGGGGGGSYFEIKELSVQSDFYNAFIKIETNFASRMLFRWGKTSSYEAEIISTGDLKKIHTINLQDLEPSTKYYFEFEVVDNIGRKIKVSNQSFKTDYLPTNDLLLNVSNFKALSDQEKINLSWKNPAIDFKDIRIIRSAKSFPRDPYDGELVYLGKGENYTDTDLKPSTDYYYTAFVEDYDGRFSSGSIARGRLLLPGEEQPELFAGVIELPPSQVNGMINKLTLRDFQFIQDGEIVPVINGNTILLKGDRVFKVLINYEKLPEILKTLAVTLKDPNDSEKVFNFLLRVNQDKTAYEASVAPLGREGLFGLSISILDHKNRGLKNLSGLVKSSLPFGVSTWNFDLLSTLFLILLILLFILMVRFFRSIPNITKRHEAAT